MAKLDARRVARLSGAAYAGMFVFGIVMALLGAVLPALAGRLKFQLADIGALFLVMNGAMLAANLVLGLAMDRFGMKPPLAVGPLLVAGALIIVARATAFDGLLPAVLLLGIGGGALNGATNTLVADMHDDPQRKSAALNRLGIFFGFGALVMPFALGSLLERFTFAALLASAAVFCAAAGIFATGLSFPEPKQGHALPVADVPRFLGHPLVLTLAGLLFFESGVEFTLGGFISTYLTRDLGTSVAWASWALAGYWASVMLARGALSRWAVQASPYRILGWSATGAAAGALLAAVAPGPVVAALAMVVMGASVAGVFPAALGIAGARFESHSGTVFGILIAVALAGGMSFPWMAGQIGEAVGLRWVMVMVAGAFAAILLLSRVAARIPSKA